MNNPPPLVQPAANAPIIDVVSSPGEEEPSELETWLKANAGKTVSVNDVINQARIEAGLDEEDMAKIPAQDRFDTTNGLRWAMNAEPPGGTMSEYTIIGIFPGDQSDRIGDHIPGETRIYVLPKVAAPTKALPCLVYKFSRVPGSGGSRSLMQLQLFIEEMAHELNRLAVVFGVIEDDEVPDEEEAKTCPACQTENDSEAKFCADCGAKLPESAPAAS